MEKYRVGIIVTDDAGMWGGSVALWEIFTSKFERYEEIELIPIFAKTEPLPDLKEIHSYDGFIVTGAFYSVNDEFVWLVKLKVFIKQVALLINGPKIFGICFGHQLIAKSLGCNVGINEKGDFLFKTEEILVSDTLRRKHYYQDCFGDSKSFKIMVCHSERVIDITPSAQTVGSSISCPNEIVLWNERVISTQGHPEFTTDFMLMLGSHLKKGNVLSEEELEKSLKTFDPIVDGNINFIKNFFINDRKEESAML